MAAPRASNFEIEERVGALVTAGATQQDALDLLAEETGRTPGAIRTACRRASAAWIAIWVAWMGVVFGIVVLLLGEEGAGGLVLLLASYGLLAVLCGLLVVFFGIWDRLPGRLRALVKVVAVGSLCLVALVFVASSLSNECEHASDGRLIGSSWCH